MCSLNPYLSIKNRCLAIMLLEVVGMWAKESNTWFTGRTDRGPPCGRARARMVYLPSFPLPGPSASESSLVHGCQLFPLTYFYYFFCDLIEDILVPVILSVFL